MSTPATSSVFYQILKEAVTADPEGVEAFFQENFLRPLDTALESTEEPAENIRNKRKQTQKIKNFLLTLREK